MEENIQLPERLERTTIYESDYVCLYADKVKLPSGDIIEKYHQIHYPHDAVVIVIFNDKGEILMIESVANPHLRWGNRQSRGDA